MPFTVNAKLNRPSAMGLEVKCTSVATQLMTLFGKGTSRRWDLTAGSRSQ